MRADTPFNIASIDKSYTACVVMKLYERGRVDIDEPVVSILPWSLIGGLPRLGGIDYTDNITVRHLLGHTSGLADCFEDHPRGGRSLMERLFREGDMTWSIEDLARLVRDQLTPHFPPQPLDAKRQKARYSDSNYQLLIAIIEVVTAQSLPQVFEEMLFRPLDLRHTYLPGHSQPLAPVSEPASLWHEGKPLEIPQAIQSFPCVYSTAEDTLKFLRAFTRGEVFDSPATLALMQHRWNRFGIPLDAAALRAPSWPIEYGLGMMRFRLPSFFPGMRPLPAVYGHTGSTGCWLFHCPQLGMLLAGAVDEVTAGAIPYRFVPKLLRALS